MLSASGLAWLLLAVVGAAGLVRHLRRTSRPLFPAGTFASRAAWGSLVVSLLVGVALIAALVLTRLLVALPIGAVVGGVALRFASAGVLTAIGMVMTAVGFVMMAQWGLTTLDDVLWPTVALVLAGFGFGLSLAPINDALLAATEAATHGVASAFVVVARMVGMLVGISVLTTLGLRLYYATVSDLPAAVDVCPDGGTCEAYTTLLREAGLVQLHTVFYGAAIAAVLAGLLALVLLRRVTQDADQHRV